jgi:prevent-host-death family protein
MRLHYAMRTIGVRELKAKLSSVLRDVQRGDHILVTDRGRVVAELRSPDMKAWAATPADRALARLAASGHLRVSENRAPTYPASPIKGRSGLARELLDAERGDT